MAKLKSHLVADFIAYQNFKYSWTYSDLGLGLDSATSNRLRTAGTFEYGGAIYDSVYVVRWSTDYSGAGFDDFRAIFGGVALSESGDGLGGGTLTGIHYQAKLHGEWKSLYDILYVSAAANFVTPFHLKGRFDWFLENWLFDEDDQMTLSAGDDRVSGFGGNDQIRGMAGDDTLSGGEGNDRVFGGSGADDLAGGSGKDRLWGQSGDDRLFGNAGADVLQGGAGLDRMFVGGDRDRDRIVFRKASDSAEKGSDRVTGFETGEDVFDFRRFDGDMNSAGRQDLVFNASGAVKNGIWTEPHGNGLRLLADVTGDAVADFAVTLINTASVSAGDLLL